MSAPPLSHDLQFATLAEREVQYDARGSVPDFDASVARYALAARAARASCAGVLDLAYGMARDERLDLFLPVAAQRPAPLLVFIHGGYWRSQRKEDAPVMAPAFTQAGVAVATLEYTLAPEASLFEIVHEVRSAVAWLHRHAAAYGIDPARIVVCGSSAGGHLAAMLAATGWQDRYGVPHDVVKGVIALSGLFDLVPLCEVMPNTWLRLSPGQASQLSPVHSLPRAGVPIVLSVGGLETEGFRRQTAAYAHACAQAGLAPQVVAAPQADHFSLLCELESVTTPLGAATLALLAATAGAKATTQG